MLNDLATKVGEALEEPLEALWMFETRDDFLAAERDLTERVAAALDRAARKAFYASFEGGDYDECHRQNIENAALAALRGGSDA